MEMPGTRGGEFERGQKLPSSGAPGSESDRDTEGTDVTVSWDQAE